MYKMTYIGIREKNVVIRYIVHSCDDAKVKYVCKL